MALDHDDQERPHPTRSGMLTTGEADRLIAWLAGAVGWLSGVRDLNATLTSTARGAADAIPGTESAGIAELTEDGRLVQRVATGELSAIADRLQNDTGEGPGLHALTTGSTVRVHDLREETRRWPSLAAAARREGIAGALCYRLDTGHDLRRIVLDLYSREPGVFDDDAVLLGELFASHAGLALAHAHNAEQLSTALSSRDLIGQAKGVLMERFGIDDYRAFGMLVESSQQTNLKLTEVAGWLVRDVERDRHR
ncbi:GAF and ANTAR domain-containing protein [Saccharopolyspora griseoalba]|uniref:GAF and ANTAR domain-containing protein n=1 Tax=Saccharopolyspora griseoalba TaxID=1431848 RepID=A0ABW2LN48_9PSEU